MKKKKKDEDGRYTVWFFQNNTNNTNNTNNQIENDRILDIYHLKFNSDILEKILNVLKNKLGITEKDYFFLINNFMDFTMANLHMNIIKIKNKKHQIYNSYSSESIKIVKETRFFNFNNIKNFTKIFPQYYNNLIESNDFGLFSVPNFFLFNN